MGTDLVHVPQNATVVRVDDFMPLMTVDQAVQRKAMMNEFINKVLKEGDDYGPMPGDNRKDKKKVLLKPGAEKLCSIFGLAPRYVKETVVEDWTGAQHGGEPLFYYEYRCQLYKGDLFVGEGIGSCNTWEAKYRWRWVREEDVPERYELDDLLSRGGRRTLFEFEFAIDKRETTGQYGKPESHWAMFEEAIRNDQARRITKETKGGDRWGYEIEVDLTVYRIPNDNPAELINTCQKIGQKRALIAATLVVTNCSDAFTQDLDDMETEPPQRNTPTQQADLAEKRVAEEKEKTANGTPAELKPFLAKIDADIQNFKGVCDHFYSLLSDKGAEGVQAYDRISREFFKRFPKGTADPKPLKALVNDLYVAYTGIQSKDAPVTVPTGRPKESNDLFHGEPAHDTVSK